MQVSFNTGFKVLLHWAQTNVKAMLLSNEHLMYNLINFNKIFTLSGNIDQEKYSLSLRVNEPLLYKPFGRQYRLG